MEMNYMPVSNLDNEIKDILKENNEIVVEKINNLIELNNIDYAKKLALELIKNCLKTRSTLL